MQGRRGCHERRNSKCQDHFIGKEKLPEAQCLQHNKLTTGIGKANQDLVFTPTPTPNTRSRLFNALYNSRVTFHFGTLSKWALPSLPTDYGPSHTSRPYQYTRHCTTHVLFRIWRFLIGRCTGPCSPASHIISNTEAQWGEMICLSLHGELMEYLDLTWSQRTGLRSWLDLDLNDIPKNQYPYCQKKIFFIESIGVTLVNKTIHVYLENQLIAMA